jgi:hypothetical protein
VGLGMAAVRDIISLLKYERQTAIPLGDQSRFLRRAIGQGASQSGRFLRTFLYDGFNADEKGRKVFDGVWAHVAGGSRGSFNTVRQLSRPVTRWAAIPHSLFRSTDLTDHDDTGISSAADTAAARVVESSTPTWKLNAPHPDSHHVKRDAPLPKTRASTFSREPSTAPVFFPQGKEMASIR